MRIRLKPPAQEIAQIDIEAVIEADAFEMIKAGFIPHSSADKWVIHMDQSLKLYVHRAATGTCIYTAQFGPTTTEDGQPAFTITEATVNRNPNEYRNTDTTYDARLLVYLLRKLLLKHDVPFPQKSKMPYRDRIQHEEHVMGGDAGPDDVIPLDLLN